MYFLDLCWSCLWVSLQTVGFESFLTIVDLKSNFYKKLTRIFFKDSLIILIKSSKISGTHSYQVRAYICYFQQYEQLKEWRICIYWLKFSKTFHRVWWMLLLVSRVTLNFTNSRAVKVLAISSYILISFLGYVLLSVVQFIYPFIGINHLLPVLHIIRLYLESNFFNHGSDDKL